jgi:hypothetical protein
MTTGSALVTTSELAGLGRLREWDEKNLDHLLPRRRVPRQLRRRMWHAGDVLDQRDTPRCVGYAGWGWLAGGPVTNRPSVSPDDLYFMAQDRDEWDGRNYDGTSTLGLMKALKDLGYIDEYKWALDAATVVSWILTTGPVLVGSDWFLDMMAVDRDGFIHPEGENYGGHEWRLVGTDLDRPTPNGTKGASRLVNSWGRKWAQIGRAWIANSDLDLLIKRNGEAVTSPEIKLLAGKP